MKNNCKRTPGSQRRAFTLIELLVVVAIIAILASILFPVFARARENARRSSCQSNLKQLGLAVAQYTQDYDERYPGPNFPQSGCHITAFQQMYPYYKSKQVLPCPSDVTRIGQPNPNSTDANCATYGVIGVPPSGYAITARLSDSRSSNVGGDVDQSSAAPAYGAIAVASVPKPAGAVLMTDGCSIYSTSKPAEEWTDDNGLFLAPPEGSPSTAGDVYCAPSFRHLATSNVLFFDGHVKAQQIDKFYYTNSPWLDPLIGGD